MLVPGNVGYIDPVVAGEMPPLDCRETGEWPEVNDLVLSVGVSAGGLSRDGVGVII
jgi:hypothetical protein